ncbi:hypothetical protein [Nocardioides daphniae]|uniref:Uncharacterized protein n=1 Tax=Nocardioides daphniae TaxID=402297 RepID=A0A4P7U8B8_9ACTN|nr:hypothetical protein [Nocardioides daphniae]QCC76246.1 hypothetical protein E2C04_01740 [Nocardioides daphniae]GGD08670.1 hypothetical protein GCM10007231_04380 [Nocardioides daphniae]
MTQLIAYYEDEPVKLKSQVEVTQLPLSSAADARSSEGIVRPKVIYVRAPSHGAPFLIPFGQYDEWSLRDRYNEAIRIMNELGAATITCETFREVSAIRKAGGKLLKFGNASAEQRKVENSGFDYKSLGTGSPPRDPRPLRWPDEPGFSAAVNSVLNNGATQVTISIKSNRSHSVDSGLGLSLKKFGFDLGASSQKSAATSLRIEANFPAFKKNWK